MINVTLPMPELILIVPGVLVMFVDWRSKKDGKRTGNRGLNAMRRVRGRLAKRTHRLMSKIKEWFSMTGGEKRKLTEFCIIAFSIFVIALALMIVLISIMIAKGIL